MEDVEIIRLFNSRDESAVISLKNKYGGFCYSIANNILHSAEDSEECVWETYLKVWNAIPPQNPRNMKVWLGRVVRNSALNILDKRKAKKRAVLGEVSFDELMECIPDINTPEKIIEGEELGEVISRWLRTLSSEDRRLFICRYWLCQPLKEISKAENISEKRLAKRMYILRNKLKNSLEMEGMSI